MRIMKTIGFLAMAAAMCVLVHFATGWFANWMFPVH